MSPRSRTPEAPETDQPQFTDEQKLDAVTAAQHGQDLNEEQAAIVYTLDEKERAKLDKRVRELDEIASIEGFSEAPLDFRAETVPQRARNAVQTAMDAIAQRAYEAWVAADKPSAWPKIPVITYFLPADEVEERKRLIRRACDSGFKVEDGPGTRVRFGQQFVLTEKLATKAGRPPEDVGKTVLAWACVDKNPRPRTEPSADGQTPPDTDHE